MNFAKINFLQIFPNSEISQNSEKKSEKEKNFEAETVPVNLKQLSKEEKIRLLAQQSPEFLPLADEFLAVEQRVAKIFPIVEKLKNLPDFDSNPALRHLRAKFEINTK